MYSDKNCANLIKICCDFLDFFTLNIPRYSLNFAHNNVYDKINNPLLHEIKIILMCI